MILALVIALLAWNIWLTQRYSTLSQATASSAEGTESAVVVQSTLTDYTTGITSVMDKAREGIVTVVSQSQDSLKTYSGVVFRKEEGVTYVFTVMDALSGMDSVSVMFDSGASIEGEIVGVDEDTGLGLLRVEPIFDVAPLVQGDSSLLGQGEYIVAAGGRRPSTGTAFISFGIVSRPGMRRLTLLTNWFAEIIETDAVACGENYGGPLLDIGGKLMGIVIPRPVNTQDRMGYAISVNEMALVCDELLENGTVAKGSLGVVYRSVADLELYEKNVLGVPLDMVEGVYVTHILQESVAEGRLLVGDIIAAVNGEQVLDVTGMRKALYGCEKGFLAKLDIIRGGESLELEITLE